MSASFFPRPVYVDFTTDVGDPSAGRQMFFYQSGSRTVKQPVYKRPKFVGQKAPRQVNPVTLGADGLPELGGSVWLDPELTYAIVLKESDGTTVWEADDIPGQNVSVTGESTLPRLVLTNSTAVSLVSTTHPAQIGPTAGVNLRFGPSNIQAVNNGAVSTLNLRARRTKFSTTSGKFIRHRSEGDRNRLDAGSDTVTLNGGSFVTSPTISGSKVFTVQGGLTLPQTRVRWDIVGELCYLHFDAFLTDQTVSVLRLFESLPIDVTPSQTQYISMVLTAEGLSQRRIGYVRVTNALTGGKISFEMYDPNNGNNHLSQWPATGDVGVGAQTIVYRRQ